MENSTPQPNEPDKQFNPAPPEPDIPGSEINQPADTGVSPSVQLPPDPEPVSPSSPGSSMAEGQDPVVFGPSQHAPVMHGPEILHAPKRKLLGSKKTVLIGALAAILLIGGSAGAFFGYYLPNKPISKDHLKLAVILPLTVP
jgi:hypothetical protein